MELNKLKVSITTPQKEWNFEDVFSCTAPGVKGSFQILLNHAPLMNKIEVGEVKINRRESEQTFATSGGFLEVLNNKISLLLETCEDAAKIDVERAKKAAERARERLQYKSKDIDILRAESALARALNRIRVASNV
jgi:F-type H+-transporting ATPase subunit epsilon